MRFVNVSLMALISGFVVAQDIDDNDVPSECRSICASGISLATTCDAQNDDDDSGYINCVCSGIYAATEVPACEACVANFDTNDGHDNDVNDLVRSCSFTTTAFSGATVTPGSALTTITGTSNSASTRTRIDDDNQSRTRITSTGTATSTSTADGFTIQTSTPTNAPTSSPTSASTSTTPPSAGVSTSPAATTTSNFGNVNPIPNKMGLVAAVFLGALGLLQGMAAW